LTKALTNDAAAVLGCAGVDLKNELVRGAWLPDRLILVGYEGRRAVALGVAALPTSVFMLAPQVCLVYNAGPPQLVRMMGQRLREWLREHGHNRVMGVNLRARDAAFMRLFRHTAQGRRAGLLMEWRL
jgi:hypothetical protein